MTLLKSARQLIEKCHLHKQNSLYTDKTLFFLIVYYQTCAKVQLFVGFKIFKTIFQGKKQSATMFHCLRKDTILLVRQKRLEI